MGHVIDYSTQGLSDEAKQKAAIKDIKEWLGAKKFNTVSRDVKRCQPAMTRVQFRFLCSIGGIQGYPVEAWADSLGVPKEIENGTD